MPVRLMGAKDAALLEVCVETADACLRTLTYCLRWGGALGESAHLLALLDCAQWCRRAAEGLAGGPAEPSLLTRCAESCERCARSCDVFDDLETRECAELCRYCAPACRRSGS